MRAPVKLFLASSNPGKLLEFRALAAATTHLPTPAPATTHLPALAAAPKHLPALTAETAHSPAPANSTDAAAPNVEIELLPEFDSLPTFEENSPTFAENAAGKALHYSRLAAGLVFADDSGLVVPALGGAPGVYSARYAGAHATNADRIAKLLAALIEKKTPERAAYFICAIALAEHGRAIAIVTASVHGEILEAPRGNGGFGYDPIFYFPPLNKSFAQLSPQEKNHQSHRGKAFRKLCKAMECGG